jgi:hypothetical protein
MGSFEELEKEVSQLRQKVRQLEDASGEQDRRIADELVNEPKDARQMRCGSNSGRASRRSGCSQRETSGRKL